MVSPAAYEQYMERVFKSTSSSGAGADAKIFRVNSDVKGVLERARTADARSDGSHTPRSEGSRTPPPTERTQTSPMTSDHTSITRKMSMDLEGLVCAVDDYGTIMTTMDLSGNGARDQAFFDTFESEKRKIALEGRILVRRLSLSSPARLVTGGPRMYRTR